MVRGAKVRARVLPACDSHGTRLLIRARYGRITPRYRWAGPRAEVVCGAASGGERAAQSGYGCAARGDCAAQGAQRPTSDQAERHGEVDGGAAEGEAQARSTWSQTVEAHDQRDQDHQG